MKQDLFTRHSKYIDQGRLKYENLSKIVKERIMSMRDHGDPQEIIIQDEDGNEQHYLMFPAEEGDEELEPISDDEIVYSEEEIAEHLSMSRERCREREAQEEPQESAKDPGL